MKITKHFTTYQQCYEINLRDIGCGQIMVSRDAVMDENPFGRSSSAWRNPTINWAGCGDQNEEKAKAFAWGIAVAVLLSVALRSEYSDINTKSLLERMGNVSHGDMNF